MVTVMHTVIFRSNINIYVTFLITHSFPPCTHAYALTPSLSQTWELVGGLVERVNL